VREVDDLIECEQWPVSDGATIGVITLTREKPLNSLLLETIDRVAGKFGEWRADDETVCILLQSSTERAFCAGADIQALYHAKEGGRDRVVSFRDIGTSKIEFKPVAAEVGAVNQEDKTW